VLRLDQPSHPGARAAFAGPGTLAGFVAVGGERRSGHDDLHRSDIHPRADHLGPFTDQLRSAVAAYQVCCGGPPQHRVRRHARMYGLGVIRLPAVWAARKAGVHFSVTMRMDPKVRAAIVGIGEEAWTSIRYPRAIWD